MKSIISFLSSRFSYMTKMSRQKFQYLQNEKSFHDEMKNIFHHFYRVSIKANKMIFFRRWESEFSIYNHDYTETHFIVYLGPYLGIGLFLSCLYDVFLIFSPILIVVNHITSLNYTGLFFVHFLEYSLLFLGDNVDEESK